jgi:hypothetical protein
MHKRAARCGSPRNKGGRAVPDQERLRIGEVEIARIEIEAGETLLVEVGDNQFLAVHAAAPESEPTLVMPRVWRRSKDKKSSPSDSFEDLYSFLTPRTATPAVTGILSLSVRSTPNVPDEGLFLIPIQQVPDEEPRPPYVPIPPDVYSLLLPQRLLELFGLDSTTVSIGDKVDLTGYLRLRDVPADGE